MGTNMTTQVKHQTVETLNQPFKDRFLRQKEVTHITGIPRPTLYLLMSKGLFPKQISIGSGHCVAWLESEVLAFMHERIAAREAK